MIFHLTTTVLSNRVASPVVVWQVGSTFITISLFEYKTAISQKQTVYIFPASSIINHGGFYIWLCHFKDYNYVKVGLDFKKYRKKTYLYTSVILIWSVCPSATKPTLDETEIIWPFLYQVMLGGGTALDSHSNVTGIPTLTLTIAGGELLWPLILGGTLK